MSFWSIVYYPSIVNKYQVFRSNIFSKTLKCKYKGDIFLCELSWNSHFLSNRNSPTEKGGKTSNRDWHVGRCSSFLSMWVILSLTLCNTHSFFFLYTLYPNCTILKWFLFANRHLCQIYTSGFMQNSQENCMVFI